MFNNEELDSLTIKLNSSSSERTVEIVPRSGENSKVVKISDKLEGKQLVKEFERVGSSKKDNEPRCGEVGHHKKHRQVYYPSIRRDKPRCGENISRRSEVEPRRGENISRRSEIEPRRGEQDFRRPNIESHRGEWKKKCSNCRSNRHETNKCPWPIGHFRCQKCGRRGHDDPNCKISPINPKTGRNSLK